MTDWLDDLYNTRREDEERQKDPLLDLSVLGRREQAISAMRVIEAHKILRRVNDALLNGKGVIKDIQDARYDQGLALIWQGSVSQARPPRPEDSGKCCFIMVTARGTQVFVNHTPLKNITPEEFKAALVKAAKNRLNNRVNLPTILLYQLISFLKNQISFLKNQISFLKNRISFLKIFFSGLPFILPSS